MPDEVTRTVSDVLARAPNWLRRDLTSDDAKVRGGAEETLAAMLSAALGKSPAAAAEPSD